MSVIEMRRFCFSFLQLVCVALILLTNLHSTKSQDVLDTLELSPLQPESIDTASNGLTDGDSPITVPELKVVKDEKEKEETVIPGVEEEKEAVEEENDIEEEKEAVEEEKDIEEEKEAVEAEKDIEEEKEAIEEEKDIEEEKERVEEEVEEEKNEDEEDIEEDLEVEEEKEDVKEENDSIVLGVVKENEVEKEEKDAEEEKEEETDSIIVGVVKKEGEEKDSVIPAVIEKKEVDVVEEVTVIKPVKTETVVVVTEKVEVKSVATPATVVILDPVTSAPEPESDDPDTGVIDLVDPPALPENDASLVTELPAVTPKAPKVTKDPKKNKKKGKKKKPKKPKKKGPKPPKKVTKPPPVVTQPLTVAIQPTTAIPEPVTTRPVVTTEKPTVATKPTTVAPKPTTTLRIVTTEKPTVATQPTTVTPKPTTLRIVTTEKPTVATQPTTVAPKPTTSVPEKKRTTKLATTPKKTTPAPRVTPRPKPVKPQKKKVLEEPCVDVFTVQEKRYQCKGYWKRGLDILALQINKLKRDNHELFLKVIDGNGKITLAQDLINEHKMNINALKDKFVWPAKDNFGNTHKDCADAFAKDHKKPGVYLIHPVASPYKVHLLCIDGWTVIQRRFDGSENFHRSFDEYLAGFGNFSGEFFVGLENLHRLTFSQAYTLRVDVKSAAGKWYFAVFDSFAITDETDQFRLKLGNMTAGNSDDVMEQSRDKPFSSFDRDNDEWSGGNCAKHFRGGWWSGNCVTNLNQGWCKSGCLRWGSTRVLSSIMRIRPSSSASPDDMTETPDPVAFSLEK
ncbi:uncharacterized protein LOC115224852 [Argonauta hians]